MTELKYYETKFIYMYVNFIDVQTTTNDNHSKTNIKLGFILLGSDLPEFAH